MVFHVGDRVCCVVDYPSNNLSIRLGMTGTVCYLSNGDPSIGVVWEQNISGHDCNGRCPYGFGWYVQEYEIEIVPLCEPADISEDDLFQLLCP